MLKKKKLEDDEPDGMWRHQILSDTRSDVSCDERVLCKKDLRDSIE